VQHRRDGYWRVDPADMEKAIDRNTKLVSAEDRSPRRAPRRTPARDRRRLACAHNAGSGRSRAAPRSRRHARPRDASRRAPRISAGVVSKRASARRPHARIVARAQRPAARPLARRTAGRASTPQIEWAAPQPFQAASSMCRLFSSRASQSGARQVPRNRSTR
jgi:hypothetical protein